MKILIVSDMVPPLFGGAGIRALRTAESLSKKVDVHVFSKVNKPETFLDYTEASGNFKLKSIKIYRLVHQFKEMFFFSFFNFLKLRGLKKPDVVHCFSVTWLTITVFWFNKFVWKKPFIFEVTLLHSDTHDSRGRWFLYKYMTNYCLSNATHINCISPALYNHMIEHAYKENKLTLISNSIDIERFKPPTEESKSKLRGKYGIGSNKFVIVTVAGVTERKGFFLIKKIVHALPDHLNFHWFFVGKKSSKEQLKFVENFYDELNTNKKNRITFTGFTKPDDYLKISDLFVFLSKREGLGTAVVEAMGTGLPVICRKIPGVTEYIVKNSKTGIIVDSEIADDFVEEILRIYNDHDFRKYIGENARKYAASNFQLDFIIDKYLKLYKKLVADA